MVTSAGLQGHGQINKLSLRLLCIGPESWAVKRAGRVFALLAASAAGERTSPSE